MFCGGVGVLGGAGGGPTEHAKRGNTLSGHGQRAQRFAEKEDTSSAEDVFFAKREDTSSAEDVSSAVREMVWGAG